MFCGSVIWARCPYLLLFTFLLFYSFTFLLLSVAVGEWCHAGALLEEVGHGTLVAEVEMVGYLAHRHIGLREQVADLLVDERCGVFVYGRPAYLLYESREISR